MPLDALVREAFSPGGVLSRAATEFCAREGQTQMALAVARTVQQGGSLVVEAGTGVGKTFAYLVPALMSGERVLLSTATKTLQDQLFGRDLPRLIEALGLPVRTALLKGRGSYLCLHRMEQARRDASSSDRNVIRTLSKVEEWSRFTKTGDLAELPGLDERSALVPLIAGSWSLATALSLLAWFVFAPQCLSTLAAVRRETSVGMAVVSAAYLFVLAYAASFVTYRVALAAGLG